MKYIFIAFLVTVSASAFSQPKPYGMAGCGLGSQLMGKDGNQILAATSNGTSGNQTFGISSGTSNCVTATNQTAQIRTFIDVNYESLVTDMAKGQGETVTTLSGFYGCGSEEFASALKSNYEAITPQSQDSTKVMVNINKVIEDSSVLSSSCTRAI